MKRNKKMKKLSLLNENIPCQSVILTDREYEIKNWNSKFQTILDSFETERALSLSLKY